MSTRFAKRHLAFAPLLGLFFALGCGTGAPEDEFPTSSTSSDIERENSDSLETTTLQRATVSTALLPTGDAMVRSGAYANTNDGTSRWLVVDGEAAGTVMESFIQFQVSSIPTGTTSVKLVVRPVDGGVIGTLYRTSAFTESTLTWNRRPARGVAVASRGSVTAGTTVELDLTAVVKSTGTYAFVLASTNADGVSIPSRESTTNRPQLVFVSDTGPAPTGCTGSTMECDAFAQINQRRAALGKAALTFNSKLSTAAKSHNNWMVSNNCFDHVCAGEPGVGTRITNAGYSWSAYGETIAAGYPTAKAVVDGWMASPGHYAILTGNYREVGISVVPCASGCTYSPYWTADFANPR